MSAPRMAGWGVLAGLVLLAGCNNQPNTVDTSGGAYREVSTPVQLVAQARPPILDLPVPIGFRLDETRSRNFAAAGARYVDHLYRGSGDKFAVARFYKRHMPISRWVLVTDMFVQGDIMLDFEKESERCRIIISQGGLFNNCTIKVQLWTTGRIPTAQGIKKGQGKK